MGQQYASKFQRNSSRKKNYGGCRKIDHPHLIVPYLPTTASDDVPGDRRVLRVLPPEREKSVPVVDGDHAVVVYVGPLLRHRVALDVGAVRGRLGGEVDDGAEPAHHDQAQLRVQLVAEPVPGLEQLASSVPT